MVAVSGSGSRGMSVRLIRKEFLFAARGDAAEVIWTGRRVGAAPWRILAAF
jgi:hypothetical protein